jgi:hypothetical protein
VPKIAESLCRIVLNCVSATSYGEVATVRRVDASWNLSTKGNACCLFDVDIRRRAWPRNRYNRHLTPLVAQRNRPLPIPKRSLNFLRREGGAVLMDISSSISSVLQAQQNQAYAEVGIAVLSKSLDATKVEGEAAVSLIQAAADIAKQLGKGLRFDAHA